MQVTGRWLDFSIANASYAGDMLGRLTAAGLGSALAVGAMSVGVLAATPTADLIPEPPNASWKVDPNHTGARTAQDVYGTHANGFADAYEKAWTQPGQGLDDRLERYSTVLWAAFRFGESEGGAQKDKTHSSYAKVRGFGNGAFEVTYPADSEGYSADELVFTEGDYIATIRLVALNATPDRNVLMDQANGQLNVIPVPVAEYNSIGNGVLNALAVFFGAVVLVILIAGAIVLIVLVRRRRPQPLYGAVAPAGLNFSPDRRYWWDGQAWQDAAVRIPPGASVSPDGRHWWDGVTWRPAPPAAR